MQGLLNGTAEISSPFRIPSQEDDGYRNFGRPDWANASTPSYAVVTINYGEGLSTSGSIDFDPTGGDLGETRTGLIANLPQQPTTGGSSGGGGYSIPTPTEQPVEEVLGGEVEELFGDELPQAPDTEL